MPFEEYLKSLIKRNIFPGISYLKAEKDEIKIKNHCGFKAINPEKELLAEDTIYDLASLTKPLITAFLTVYLIENKNVSLNTEIKKIFPDYPQPTRLIHLLSHTSGLPAWMPLYLYEQKYIDRLIKTKLLSRPGKRVIYSCLGYILLYCIIEKVTSEKFENLAFEIIIKKLGLRNTFFKPPAEKVSYVAPTEHGNQYEKEKAQKITKIEAANFIWRDYIIRGETHDVNSYHLGGTAGNSGLFSTTGDLFRLSMEFFPSTATILNTESLKLFWQNITPKKLSHRSIGFKINSSILRPAGKIITRKAIGHSGFTGTAIWFEPENETKYILLTNRIHPYVRNINFDGIRKKIIYMLKKEQF